MNAYKDFFYAVDPEDWEFFALDFLESLGFRVERRASRGADGGRDGLVSWNGKTYLVSCKHFFSSEKAVGVGVEHSIVDRIIQHGATGFIGFYSTSISTSLDERLHSLSDAGYECIIFDENNISNYLPNIPSRILQKYGLPKGIVYPLHVDQSEYFPLPCLRCGVDILREDMIPSSIGLICLNLKGSLEYLYGCKNCFTNIEDLAWIELHQALHQEELVSWICYVNNRYLKAYFPSEAFYKHRSEFEGGIQQRMFPSNWGRWFPGL